MTNPFDAAERTAESHAEAGKFDLADVTGVNESEGVIAVDIRSDEASGAFPVTVPEDKSVPPRDSLVVVGYLKGDRKYLAATVESPDGSTDPSSSGGLTFIGDVSLQQSPTESILTIGSETLRYAAGTDGTDVYIAGGVEGGSTTANAYVFDVSAGTRSSIASLPIAADDVSGAVIDDTFYVVGGLDGSNTALDTLHAYDISADAWSTAASLPAARYGTASAVYNGELYVFGGNDSSFNTVDSVYKYDPVADSWSTLTSLPSARTIAATAYFDGDIWITGGFDSSGSHTSTVWLYDPDTDSYDTTSVSDMSIALAGHAIGVSRNKIHTICGEVSSGAETISIHTYYSSTDSWISHFTLTGKSYLRAESIGDDIYVGYGEGDNTLHRFTYPDPVHTATQDALFTNYTVSNSIINDTTGGRDTTLMALDGEDLTLNTDETISLYRQN